MDRDTIEKLRDEQIDGNKASIIFETWVAPFIEYKKKELFAAFIDVSYDDIDTLTEIKRMMNTIDQFGLEIAGFIDTGKMASISLSEHNKQYMGDKH